MSLSRALGSGLAGAIALTLLHESARRMIPEAPRMDLLGMRAIARTLRAADQEPPPPDQLHPMSLAADLLSNSLYYSLIGAVGGHFVWLWGALLGLLAGIGGVVLPPLLGLGSKPSARTPATALMTVAWYTVGGLIAAAAYRKMQPSSYGEIWRKHAAV